MSRTRTRARRRSGRPDARAALIWAAALVALVVVIWVVRHPLAGYTLAALVLAAAGWRVARPRLERTPGPGRRPAVGGRAEAAPGPAELLAAERRARAAAESTLGEVRDQLADLEHRHADALEQLAEARESAAAAWDAAASAPPAPRTPADDLGAREGLLGDPRSGARPLVGGDQ
jgi:hypothetical protein